MINVALLSRWHVHADDYAKEAMENEHITIKGVWDEDEARGKKWADELQVRFEADLDTLLADSSIDAVIVDTPTTDHREVIIKAAKYGKHIFSEKVLGLTTEECQDIFDAVDQNNVSLMLSLPRLSAGYYILAQEMLNQGLLGELTLVRCRVAHDGALPEEGNPNGWLPPHFLKKEGTGGGALIDLGAHPIYLTNRLGGKVASLSAKLNYFLHHEVDDQAAIVVDYESGALGIIEVGFVSSGSFYLELHGTEGIYIVEGKEAKFKSKIINNGEWVVPDVTASDQISAMQQWVNQIQSGEPPLITRDDMLNLTKINEAAIQSDKEGRRINF